MDMHMDKNPRNILVDENDQLKLADFDHTLLIICFYNY